MNRQNNEWFKTVFIRYLKKMWDRNALSLTKFVSVVFRSKERSIMTMECVQDIQLRGAVWVDSKPIEGLIERRILQMRKGQPLWVRDDEGDDFVTVENSRGCINIKKKAWENEYKRFFEYRHRDNDA